MKQNEATNTLELRPINWYDKDEGEVEESREHS